MCVGGFIYAIKNLSILKSPLHPQDRKYIINDILFFVKPDFFYVYIQFGLVALPQRQPSPIFCPYINGLGADEPLLLKAVRRPASHAGDSEGGTLAM